MKFYIPKQLVEYPKESYMNVIIYETEHFEVAASLIKLFAAGNCNLTLIINSRVNEKLSEVFEDGNTQINKIILPKKISRLALYQTLQKYIDKIQPDLFYLNTVSSNHILFAWLLKKNKTVRSILTVHAINCLFEPIPFLGFKKIIRYFGKRMLVNNVNEFNVISETMTGYLHNKNKKKKTIHNIPGAVFTGQQKNSILSDVINLVIPGSIDYRRRNYEEVIELIELADKTGLPVNITLAGGYYAEFGEDIINRMKKLQLVFCSLTIFGKEELSQSQFEMILLNSHFIYMPCVINTAICGKIKEVYGVTMSSGNISDAIQFARPFIAPRALRLPQNLISSCMEYSNKDELLGLLLSLFKKPDSYQKYCDEALKNSMNYTIEKIRKANPSVFF